MWLEVCIKIQKTYKLWALEKTESIVTNKGVVYHVLCLIIYEQLC